MPIPLLAIAWWLAGPAKLDNDTERWLKQVHLLMLPDEEAVFRGLEDAADRQEFERIFWARRDPDPSTAANELQGMVSRAWAAADARFPSPGRKGSESGCGQVLALLGEPLEVEGREMKTRFESLPAMREGARRPEVWTYRSRPGDAVELTGGELRIAFDEECRFPEAGRVLAGSPSRRSSSPRSPTRRSRTDTSSGSRTWPARRVEGRSSSNRRERTSRWRWSRSSSSARNEARPTRRAWCGPT